MICSHARSVSPSVSSPQYRLSGSAFCIHTTVSRSPAFMTEKTSLLSGELWAPVTSALNTVPEPPCEMMAAGTCCLMRVLASV